MCICRQRGGAGLGGDFMNHFTMDIDQPETMALEWSQRLQIRSLANSMTTCSKSVTANGAASGGTCLRERNH
jgi:hypothetical protein